MIHVQAMLHITLMRQVRASLDTAFARWANSPFVRMVRIPA